MICFRHWIGEQINIVCEVYINSWRVCVYMNGCGRQRRLRRRREWRRWWCGGCSGVCFVFLSHHKGVGLEKLLAIPFQGRIRGDRYQWNSFNAHFLRNLCIIRTVRWMSGPFNWHEGKKCDRRIYSICGKDGGRPKKKEKMREAVEMPWDQLGNWLQWSYLILVVSQFPTQCIGIFPISKIWLFK